MQKDVNLAEQIICGEKAILDNIYNEMTGDYLEKIYSQFNSLSIIYQKPEEKFIKNVEPISRENEKPLIKPTATEEVKQTNVPQTTNVDLLVYYLLIPREYKPRLNRMIYLIL
jgi:hypothetical protein